MATSPVLKRWGLRRHPDEDVFALAFGGDPVAFSEIYRRYSRPIHGYCLARLLDPSAAADVTQEVFMRLLDAPRSGIEEPRAWLYKVAHNATVDAIRKRARTPEPTNDEAIERVAGGSASDAADEFLGRQDAHSVFIALRRLRPRYRTALILRELHHQSSADMADAMGTTPGAVDTVVSRARDAFGRMFAEVAGLPHECRDAVAAIYKKQGTGLDAGEAAKLESHLVVCSNCRAEMKRASRPDRLSALLPFLIPPEKAGNSLFESAAHSLRRFPDLSARLGYVVPGGDVAPSARIAAGLLAVTLAAAPIVGTVAHRHAETVSRPVTPATPGQQTSFGAAGQDLRRADGSATRGSTYSDHSTADYSMDAGASTSSGSSDPKGPLHDDSTVPHDSMSAGTTDSHGSMSVGSAHSDGSMPSSSSGPMGSGSPVSGSATDSDHSPDSAGSMSSGSLDSGSPMHDGSAESHGSMTSGSPVSMDSGNSMSSDPTTTDP